MRVFVVWEPILTTDWSPPTTFALHRIPDLRAQQYWDPDIIAKLAADRWAPQPSEECCEQSGFCGICGRLSKGVTWNERMPTAVLFNGP